MICLRGTEQQSKDSDRLFWIPALPLTLGRICISLRLFFLRKKREKEYLPHRIAVRIKMHRAWEMVGVQQVVGPSPHWTQ